MPVRAALELFADREQRILRKRHACELKSQRQIARESTGQRKRRQAGQIDRRGELRDVVLLRFGERSLNYR